MVLVGAVTLAVTAAVAPAAAARPAGGEPTAQGDLPDDCQDGWCAETLPPRTVGVRGMTVVRGGEVWAVGADRGPGALALRWDGQAWQKVATPPLVNSYLSEVSGWTKNDVWAVGTQNAGEHTLTQHWDGREWTVVPSPDLGSSNDLLGVAAAGPHDVWAVGDAEVEQVGTRPLLMRWDGQSWSLVPTPLSDSPATFRAVVARSPHDVWIAAVVGSERRTAVTLHWDGREWRRIDVPDPGDVANVAMGAELHGQPLLTVVARDDPALPNRSHLWSWNGTAWTRVPVPVIDDQRLALGSMASDNRGRVWLLGGVGRGDGAVVEWDGSQWTRTTLTHSGGHLLLNDVVVSQNGQEVWLGGEQGVGRHHHAVMYVRR
nr:hypothetical protein GCM10020241_10410 [Streptoalloteichus tenebrarius]